MEIKSAIGGVTKILAILGGLRLISVILALIHSFVLVRFLSLDDIGWYFLITTIAYLGNASVFVGADFYLQRKLPLLSTENFINRRAFAYYISITSAIGVTVVILASAVYFWVNANHDMLLLALVCALLSVSTYLATLARSLCQLANMPTYSSMGPIVEWSIKVSGVLILALSGSIEPIMVATIGALAAILASIVMFWLLLRQTNIRPTPLRHATDHTSYITSKKELSNAVFSVGAGGVLNWALLQGYRPLLVGSGPELSASIGTVSFLSALGTTAASSVYMILAQLRIPLLYQSRGDSTIAYLRAVGILAIALSLVCLPLGILFLWATSKWTLLSLVYLVVVGVLLEAGNAAIGVCSHHRNAQEQGVWPFSFMGLVGCAITFSMLLFPVFDDVHLVIASALICGQATAVFLVIYITLKKR